ncbi:MAG: SDR family NAD(P)-dependent oxidoreductase, partial [Gammaproteobacteria bacterium]|nr:SDR family NAD(P)-dependent oxidoreductase [Gammaproteobacteria bacterium]
MDRALQGKVAAVTGGTAGIGLGIARAFLAEGAMVALMARGKARAERALAELDAGERCVFIPGDAMVRADVEGFVDGTLERFGRIDVLVNNAGGAGELKPLVELSDEAFDQAMKWNL